MTEYRASFDATVTFSNGGDLAVRTLLLGAGIPVIEHLTGLDQLPPAGASFTAVPLRVQGLGTITVRAFARLPV